MIRPLRRVSTVSLAFTAALSTPLKRLKIWNCCRGPWSRSQFRRHSEAKTGNTPWFFSVSSVGNDQRLNQPRHPRRGNLPGSFNKKKLKVTGKRTPGSDISVRKIMVPQNHKISHQFPSYIDVQVGGPHENCPCQAHHGWRAAVSGAHHFAKATLVEITAHEGLKEKEDSEKWTHAKLFVTMMTHGKHFNQIRCNINTYSNKSCHRIVAQIWRIWRYDSVTGYPDNTRVPVSSLIETFRFQYPKRPCQREHFAQKSTSLFACQKNRLKQWKLGIWKSGQSCRLDQSRKKTPNVHLFSPTLTVLRNCSWHQTCWNSTPFFVDTWPCCSFLFNKEIYVSIQ